MVEKTIIHIITLTFSQFGIELGSVTVDNALEYLAIGAYPECKELQPVSETRSSADMQRDITFLIFFAFIS